MSSKRYWSKMNHAEARNAIELMSDAEAGRWLRGWLSGAFGEESTDGTPMEWRMGFSAGKDSLRDAEEFSKKQAERVSARYTKATTVDPVEEKLPEATGDTTEFQRIPLDLPITEQTNKQTEQRTRTRRAAFTPPTLEEVREHAAKIGVVDPDKFFHHHATKGWVIGKACTPMKSWQHAMHTWLLNQRAFAVERSPGLFAPQPAVKPEPDYANDPRYRPAWAV